MNREYPAQIYERFFVPAMFRPWAARLLAQADLRPGTRFLDVACGTGIVARLAAAQVGPEGRVAALDVNPAMLSVARALPAPPGAAIEWWEGSALAMPFEDGSFDVVACQHGLPFFPDRAGALRDMRRVLAPGGRALVMVLQSLDLHPAFQALMTSVARHLGESLAAVTVPFALGEARELRGLAGAAGFRRAELVPETVTVRFPEADRFVPLAVASSAAAVPAFARLDEPAQAELLDLVRRENDPMLRDHRDGDAIVFPMWAHVLVGEG